MPSPETSPAIRCPGKRDAIIEAMGGLEAYALWLGTIAQAGKRRINSPIEDFPVISRNDEGGTVVASCKVKKCPFILITRGGGVIPHSVGTPICDQLVRRHGEVLAAVQKANLDKTSEQIERSRNKGLLRDIGDQLAQLGIIDGIDRSHDK